MRLMDLIMALPSLLLAILIVAVLGPGLTNAIVAVTIVLLPRYVRLARASALAELGKDYVVAAQVAGVGRLRLMFSTVLPNCLAPLIVQAALGVSDAILDAAALGFLGLGAQPPTPEWGTMLADAREFIRSRSVGGDAAGAGDPGHRAGVQPRGRRLARRARSEDAAVLTMPLLEIRNLSVTLRVARRRVRAVDGVDVAVESDEVLASSANRAPARAWRCSR